VGEKLYRYDYSREELARWTSRLAVPMRGRTLYAFFNNDYHAYAPHNAAVFAELLQKRK